MSCESLSDLRALPHSRKVEVARWTRDRDIQEAIAATCSKTVKMALTANRNAHLSALAILAEDRDPANAEVRIAARLAHNLKAKQLREKLAEDLVDALEGVRLPEPAQRIVDQIRQLESVR